MHPAIRWIAFLIPWTSIIFTLGMYVGSCSANKQLQPNVVSIDSDICDVQGVAWYSEQDKVWKFRSGDRFDDSPHTLSKTETLEEMATFHRNQQRQYGRKMERDCPVAAWLQVRIVNMPEEIMPGWSAEYEVVRVSQIATAFCLHCLNAPKAGKE